MTRRKVFYSLKLIAIILVLGLIAVNLLPGAKVIDYSWTDTAPVNSSQFERTLGFLLGPQMLTGNSVQVFDNGSEIFPAMLRAISSAKKSITFEAYIYWSDEVGQKFIDALSERARAGVQVFVLVDWLGSRQLTNEYKEKMKDAGVQLEIYRPPTLGNLTRLNNRTHRRILVIDGKTGFTGGVGISDDWNWDGQREAPRKWHDVQVRLEGPAVAYLQSAFMDNWLKLHSQVPNGEKFFPPLSAQGPGLAQVFKSSYDQGSESVRLMFEYAIVTAKKNIRIATAYFVPDEAFLEEIKQARAHGVQVQIMIPGPYIDTHIVKKASRANWGKLLQAGVEIFEYQKARFHCKYMVIDDQFVSIGSTNFDNRSFRLNDEANLNVLDPELAARFEAIFEKDKAESRPVTFQKWQNRPWSEKLLENFASLLETQL